MSCARFQQQKIETDILSRIQTSGELRVATTGDYRPFTYLSSNGSYSGMDIELAKNLADALNVNLIFVKTSWPTLSEDLKNNRFDIAMGGISRTVEREKIGSMSLGYITSGKTPVARCSDKIRFQTLEQIDQKDVKVIVNPGGTNEKFVRENLKKSSITVYQDNNTIFKQIVENKVDVMITDSTEVDLVVKLYPTLCAVTPGKTFDQSEKVYFMPKDMAWKTYVNKWLDPLIKENFVSIKYQEALKHFSSEKN